MYSFPTFQRFYIRQPHSSIYPIQDKDIKEHKGLKYSDKK